MDRERARRGVRPRWPAVTRTSLPTSGDLVPTLLPSPAATPVRVRSQRHVDLVRDLEGSVDRPADWPSRALLACLQRLLVSTVTEAGRVWIVDAWAEPGDAAVCVVYRPPHDEGRVVGLRRRRHSAVEPSDWRIGDLTTWGWDVGVDAHDGHPVDAERFGWNVADFDVGEPLGYVTTVLRTDDTGIGWWGDLGEQLPGRPAG